MGKELSICKFRVSSTKMRLCGVQVHTVWSKTVTLNSKAGTVVSGSVLLQSREVTSTSTDPREAFKSATLDTDSCNWSCNCSGLAKDLPRA